MQIHIFRGPGRIFGFTPHDDATTLPVAYAPWTAFKTLDVDRDTPQVSFNVNECLDDIETYGFHLTDAHVRIAPQAAQGA